MIGTARLRLVPLTTSMAEAVLTGAPIEAAVAPGWPGPDRLAALALAAAAGVPPAPTWLLIHRVDRTVIGDCGWHAGPDQDGAVEIFYRLVPTARGQGYGMEAVGALVEQTLLACGVRRVTAVVSVSNEASRRLLAMLRFALTATSDANAHYVRERAPRLPSALC